MKRFINDPKDFVNEIIEGMILASAGKLEWIPERKTVYRTDMPRDDKVSIIQGCGAGHDPAPIMCVGRGMLDGALCGGVFSAPPMEYCYELTKLMKSDKGVLFLVVNYQGDVMNWSMAHEMAEADGIKTAMVIINDDVAVPDSTYSVGRRGVAGNFFVVKACGAAAEQGASLEELVALGKKVNSVIRTYGVALTSCTPPAKGQPIFDIGDDEIEMGIGVHGEPGRYRTKLKAADVIVDEMLEAVASDLPFKKGDRVALMVNGMGGTPINELYLLYRRAALNCRDRGIKVVRNYIGNYFTSLEMAGCSLTLIRLDEEIERLLAAPAEIPIHVF
ncbi:dihydroxyacetone kinase subunit DhaK [Chloroflexota bacterium]